MEFCMKPHELRPGDIAYIEKLYLPLSISLLFFYTIAIALFRSLGLMIHLLAVSNPVTDSKAPMVRHSR